MRNQEEKQEKRWSRWPGRFASLLVLAAVGCGSGTYTGAPRKCRDVARGQGQALSTSSRLLLTESLVAKLQARAAAGDPAWASLAAKCDAFATGTVYPPSGDAYPGGGSVGQGYQGDGYLAAIQNLGLCYRTTKGVNDVLAQKYAAAGIKVLEAMSTPSSSGGAKPSTDSGYGIRNYGVGMAMGYDWLLPELSATTKQQVVSALNAWIDWYDQSGFTNDDPIANYFVGYFLAKTYTAIATEADNPKASAYWNDVETHLWGQLVKPRYTAYMKGGGWPEGWQYGPRAVRGMAECLWAVKTGKNLAWYAELPQAREQAAYLAYFVWPSLSRMDDQGTVRAGSKLAPSAALYTGLATILAELGEPDAPLARAVAADVVATGDDREPWQAFLYGDPALPSISYKSRPLSYAAEGPGHAAMRSSWDGAASWGTLSAGRYVNAADSGEQMFNAGGVSVVAGGTPVLVNATGWIPQTAGTAGEDFVYTDSWGGGGRRLYNTFFVESQSSNSPGQNTASPETSKAHLERYEEGGLYVRTRAANLEDQYGSGGDKPVTSYTRDLVFVRPGTFVLFDRTVVASPGADRWMAFHFPSAPASVTTPDATERRFDVSSGSLRLLLPASPQIATVSLPGGTTRIEAHAAGSAAQQWLSVVTTGAAAPAMTRISSAGANAVGVEVHSSRDQIILFPSDQAVSATLSSLAYGVSASADADHLLVDMAPSPSGYSVTAQPSSSGLTITVAPGGQFQVSSQGVLAFAVTQSGTVTAPSIAPPSGGGSGGATGTGGESGSGGASGSGSEGSASGSGGASSGAGSSGSGSSAVPPNIDDLPPCE